MNRTLVEAVRCMLSDSKLDKSFWAEAIATAVYIKNRCPSSALKDMTPYEALFDKKPCVSNFKVFGCICYAHIPKDERFKFDSKSKKCIFLGYSSSNKDYKLMDLASKKIVCSRDVIFDELSRVSSKEEHKSSNVSDVNSCDVNRDCVNEFDDGHRRSNRENRTPDRFGEWTYLCSSIAEPATVKEALQSSEAKEGQSGCAMQREIDSIHKNEVWSLVKPPNNCEPIES